MFEFDWTKKFRFHFIKKNRKDFEKNRKGTAKWAGGLVGCKPELVSEMSHHLGRLAADRQRRSMEIEKRLIQQSKNVRETHQKKSLSRINEYFQFFSHVSHPHHTLFVLASFAA